MNFSKKDEIIEQIKKVRLIRLIAFPCNEIKNYVQRVKFKKTDDYTYLKNLKNEFYGHRCFIIGNGPSLTIDDLEKLNDEYTFASNGIVRLFQCTKWRPTFYMCTDPDVYPFVKEEVEKSVEIPYRMLRKGFSENVDGVHHFYYSIHYNINLSNPKTRISEEAAKQINPGGTITFAAIQMAIYLGFKEIYLLGVDHFYSLQADKYRRVRENPLVQNHAKGIPDFGRPLQNVEVSTAAYECARQYCNSHDIKIYNATRGGKLEVFERVDFDNLIKKAR